MIRNTNFQDEHIATLLKNCVALTVGSFLDKTVNWSQVLWSTPFLVIHQIADKPDAKPFWSPNHSRSMVWRFQSGWKENISCNSERSTDSSKPQSLTNPASQIGLLTKNVFQSDSIVQELSLSTEWYGLYSHYLVQQSMLNWKRK